MAMQRRSHYAWLAMLVTAGAAVVAARDTSAGCEGISAQNQAAIAICSPGLPGPIPPVIDLGSQNDTLTLLNLTNFSLATTTLIDGGTGVDTVTLNNTQMTASGRILNWETVNLTNGSELTLNSSVDILEKTGSGDGTGTIDGTSTLFAGGGVNPSILSSAGGQPVLLQNAGLIDLTNGGTGPVDTLTVFGNYQGFAGRLALETFLASDGAPSDKLAIRFDAGTPVAASGITFIEVTNFGGPGALTVGNGILVVDAMGTATTSPVSFALAAPVVAGPYEYMLFRGAVDSSNPEAWYLRSNLDCLAPGAPSPPCPSPQPGPTPPTPPGPVPPTPPGPVPPTPPGPVPPTPSPEPVPPSPPVPNFRQEVSLYSAMPSLALLYGRALMDTLHQRVGEEEHLRFRTDIGNPNYVNGAWGRVIGQRGSRDGHRIGIFGEGPEYDFDFIALQAGLDVYRAELAGGYRTHAGVYGALGDGRSDVTHFNGLTAGHDTFSAYSAGGYWTLFGPTGWYLDSVIQGTWYDMKGQSTRLPALETDGLGFASSLEAGVPFRFGGFVVEPQAQLVYQSVDLDNARDIGAEVRFEDVESLAGRLGVRFASTWTMPGIWGMQPGPVTAWLRPNYWYELSGDPRTLFSSATGFIPFRADLGEDWVEINTGITAQVGPLTALYANASYQLGVDGDSEAWDGKIGLRVNW